MKHRKILAFLIIIYVLFPTFFLPSLNSSSNIFPPILNNNIDISSVLNPSNIESPYYQDYINKYNWEFDPTYAPLQILTIIHHDQNSNLDDFGFLSAIPIAIFNDSGIRKLSPIIYDNIISNPNAMDFLMQWKKYNDYFGGLKRVIYIGDVSDSVKNIITNIFGAPSEYRPPLNFSSSNVYDLSARLANYFWFTSSKVVIAVAKKNIAEFESSGDLTPIINTVGKMENASLTDTINATVFDKYYNSSDININGGAILVEVNDTTLELELIGNYSIPSNQWIFDTTNFTNNNWVFFPNVTHPANISDWGIHVFNSSEIATNITYNLKFYNYTSNFHNFRVNYSNCRMKFTINTSDAKLWLIEPNGQFYSVSNSSGEITINYPVMGDWKLIVSGNETHNISYEISINMANYSTEKEKIVESATNGAVIASQLHAPLLYTDGTSLKNEIENVLTKLNPNEAIIVEPGNTINETLITELGISVKTLENMSIVMEYIKNITYERDIVLTSLKDGFFAPSGLIATYHGGAVLPVYNSTYNFYGKALQNYKLIENSYFQSPLRNGPFYYDMVNLSDIYHNWINSLDPSVINRTVVVVSPLDDLNPIFDRAIMGKSIVGRFPGDNETETVLFMSRNIFYRALIYKNMTADSEIIYRQTSKAFHCTGLVMTNFTGTNFSYFERTFENDSIYHLIGNASSGEIQIPYYINLANHEIIFENITEIEITLIAHISYNTSNVTYAGWKIFNWTSQNLISIDDNVFNDTTEQFDRCKITLDNVTNFVNSTLNNRIDIYFYVNTTGPNINASIDYLSFNTSFKVPFAKQQILSSCISYWHNFTIFSQTYNYSEAIPELFQNYSYVVVKATGYNEIINTLNDTTALWYHCGLGSFPANPIEDSGNLTFQQNNYSRGYNLGGNELDPLGSQGNPITPADLIWRTSENISNSLINMSVNLSVIVLNDDYLASTQIPLTYLRKGATSVIANLRKNTLGYSEHLHYNILDNMIERNSSGISMIEGFKKVSHLYSLNYQSSIIESPPFDQNTEESHQYILFGDSELILANSSSRLILPGNYKPLFLKVTNETIRTANWSYILPPDQQYLYIFNPGSDIELFPEDYGIYVNITDIDSDISDCYIEGYFYVDSENKFLGAYLFEVATITKEGYNLECDDVPFNGSRVFFYDITDAPLDQNGIRIDWIIKDGTENTMYNSYLTLISSPPIFWQYWDDGSSHDLSNFTIYDGINSTRLDYNEKNEIGRVNETLIADIVVGDPDFDRLNPDDYIEVVLCMNITTPEGNHWINITLDLNETINQFNDPSLEDPGEESDEIYGRCSWNGSYTFTDDDPIGEYDFWILTKDTYNNQSRFDEVEFTESIEIKDWYAEIDNFSNNTNEIFRINETLTINATFFDRDDYLDDDNLSKPQLYNDSNLFRCEENASLSLTNIEINGTYFGNDYRETYYDDSVYHSVVNDSNGEILIPYAINLTNAAVIFENITEIEIKLKAKINSTVNISFAGWKIYNWTSNSMIKIEDLVFNDTVENLDVCYLTNQNLSHFVNETYDNRIEIFFYMKTNNSNSTMAEIDYICFNVTYPVNRTGISAEIQLEYLDGQDWINRTMDHDKIREFWSFSWTFSSLDKSGWWRIHFNLTDKEGISYVYDTNYNISVKNHIPILTNWYKTANAVYRNEIITFYANASDIDTYNRSEDLLVNASLYHADSNKRVVLPMPFNKSINAWLLNWVVPYDPDDVPLGNYTYDIEVVDSAKGLNYINTTLNFTILNNFPVINISRFVPSDFKLFNGESIQVEGNISDVEYMHHAFAQLNDSGGKMVKQPIMFPYQSKNYTFKVRFSSSKYRSLSFKGHWRLHIFLYDGENGSASVSYTLSLQMPPILPPPPPFQWEYLIIAGLIVSVILGTILVYRFYKREHVVVPSSRVKAIIKKMIEEKEIAELEEEKLIKERKMKEKLKKKPSKKIKKVKPVSKEKLVVKKEKLDKLEIKNLEVRLSETLNSARQAIRKKNFNYAAELYQRAAKISSKLGDIDKAQRFSERAEELYKRGKKKLS